MMKSKKHIHGLPHPFVSQLIQFISSFRFWFVSVCVYFIFCSTVYAVMSVVNHSHYQTFEDLANFNQGIWMLSRFQWPIITISEYRPFFGFHFDPILLLIVPFYWIFANAKTLLILQPFILLSAIIPIFLISMRMTKSILFSFSMIIAYSFYIPLQYAIFYDFHDIAFLPPLFAWAYYFFIKKNKLYTSLFLFLCLLVKEEIGLFVAAFGVYLLFFHSGWRKYGLVWILIGIGYTLFIMHILIPGIAGSYKYFDYGQSGKTPTDVAFMFLRNPTLIISSFSDSPVKTETLHQTFWPFAYLPLFSPIGLILSLEQFFTRFLDYRNVVRWTIGYHYSTVMTIVVVIGTIWSAQFYTHFFPKYRRILFIFLAVLILFLTRIEQINRSAVLLVKRPIFWARDSWMDYNDMAILKIPAGASISTQNNIISHVSSNNLVYSLHDRTKADYMLVDFHAGQSGYNFFGDEIRVAIEKEVASGIQSGALKVVFHQGDTYLLKRHVLPLDK